MASNSAVGAAPAGVVLIVSKDNTAAQQLAGAMKQLAITPEFCAELTAVQGLLNTRKFEAVVLDLEMGAETLGFLDTIRQSRSNRTAVTFTISSGEDQLKSSFKAGANFVLRRPLSVESTTRILKIAYGLIVRERRRYFRYAISIPVALRPSALAELNAETVNISEGGVAVKTISQLNSGTQADVSFVLPGTSAPFSSKSVVCWRERQQLGLQFLSPPPEQLSVLQAWLSMRLEESLPQGVVDKFRNR